ncbi:ABC transporter permease [Vibrio azureus]|uniref:Putative ABC transporter permease protein n=1 Tax=Vibrio azureus NBRC 104587 TaxID=1219077 RepID=U3A4J6_9VIBR|nr:FtsX-like permease family protein [Vibrio azureus]AUI88192.1 ABC transporter permease [Vibrio azureus]GAD74911.1 putative ABC transporter permease protein [Vibrio azureus NBRC 104587]
MKSASLNVNKSLARWGMSEIFQGKLWPVGFALVLIIASIFALSALAMRMELVVVKQGKEALTADAVFASANPLPHTLLSASTTLERSMMTQFNTMLFSDTGMQLISVRAVDEYYPLIGDLVLDDSQVHHVGESQLWLDKRIMTQLELSHGDVVTLGDADFKVSGIVLEEPGLSFNPFQQMPSAYIHSSDIKKTGVIQLGSRVQYRMFLNGEPEKLIQLQESVELSPSDKWQTQETTNRSSEFFERTIQYLSLTVIMVIIMSATTLVLTCQSYVNSRSQTIAMLKSLGASTGWVCRWLLIQISLLFLSSILIGLIVGIGLEYLLRIPLSELLPNPLPSYGITPFAVSVLSVVLISLPALGIPLSHLVNTPAIDVLQQSQWRFNKQLLWLILIPLIPLLAFYSKNALILLILLSILVLFIVLALISVGLTRVLSRLSLSSSLALAFSRINRTPVSSGLQLSALALSLMLLATIGLLRHDLIEDWQQVLPEHAPNVFALNISEQELNDYLTQLDSNQVIRSEAFPIIRGRLQFINQQDVKELSYPNGKPNAIQRELNFTWGNDIPDYNQIVLGEWSNYSHVSVEEKLANELGIQVGDKLGFVINSQFIEATVGSLRHVEWRDMKPNFYFIFSSDIMQEVKGSYLLSYRIEEDQQSLLQQLSRQYPTVTVLDIQTMGNKIQALLQQVMSAVTILATLGLLAGLLLIFTLLQLSISQRQSEVRLYRTLGASKKRIASTLWVEFGIIAFVASFIAVLSAETMVAIVVKQVFEISPQLHPFLWLVLPIATSLVLAVVVMNALANLLKPHKP